MSSQDYLKQAAAMIRRAALARKQEVDELRHELDAKDQQRRELVNQKEMERALRLKEAGDADNDMEKGSKTREAHILSVEKSQIEQEYTYQKKQLDEQLSNMQRSIDELNQMAQSLGG